MSGTLLSHHGKITRAQLREIVEQLLEILAGGRPLEPSPIERYPRLAFSVLHDDARPRDPIFLFALDQVTEDVERAP